MPGREQHALEIPSMVDSARVRSRASRAPTRAALGIADDVPLIGWVGRLDAKKRVEDFIDAAALVHAARPDARFVVIGGPDAFMPDYADALRAQAQRARARRRADASSATAPTCPSCSPALDIFVWLSRGEGMPHVIAEAGAAGLPVIATPDNGALEQIEDGVTGLFVPHEDPPRGRRRDRAADRRPGAAPRGSARRCSAKVERDYAVAAVVPQWERAVRRRAGRAPPPPARPALFRSFFQGGFECSTHRRAHDRQRLDVIAASHHDDHAEHDYRAARAATASCTVRDGLRWHLIERAPGRYDWSSLDAAARRRARRPAPR